MHRRRCNLVTLPATVTYKDALMEDDENDDHHDYEDDGEEDQEKDPDSDILIVIVAVQGQWY